MSPELIAILSIGVALAGLNLRQSFRIDNIVRDLGARIDSLNARIDGLAHDVADVRERLARLEGVIEGLFQPRPIASPTPPDQHHEAA